jgi:ribosomal-protein-alanine N-acetyltransferase
MSELAHLPTSSGPSSGPSAGSGARGTPGSAPAAPATQPALDTSRLQLRPISAADAPLLHPCFADPETMRFMDHVRSRSVADTANRIAPYLIALPAWHATWTMTERASGAAVGFVNYHHREDWNRRLELGFMLGRPFWGHGLMAEALAALIRHSFGVLGMIRIEATVQPDNLRATALLDRLGFRLEGGPLRRRMRVGGEARDLMIYGLLSEEWPPAGATDRLANATVSASMDAAMP